MDDLIVLCPVCAETIEGPDAQEALSHIGEYPGEHMHGVTQKQVGYPKGECVRASYASILGLPLEGVPRLDPEVSHAAGIPQRVYERDFLRGIGLMLVEMYMATEDPLPKAFLANAPKIYHLLSGLSERNLFHRCVGFGGKVAFDPHPSRAGLVTVNAIGFLAPVCSKCELLCAGHGRR